MLMPLRKSSTHWKWILSTVSSCSVEMSWNWVPDSERWSATAGWVEITRNTHSQISVFKKSESLQFLLLMATVEQDPLSCCTLEVFPSSVFSSFLVLSNQHDVCFWKVTGDTGTNVCVYADCVYTELVTDVWAAVGLTVTDEEATLWAGSNN